MQHRRRHPALDHLDALVGAWETEATHPGLPNTLIRGQATFEWLAGGFFLIWRAACDHPDIPTSIAILGCDDAMSPAEARQAGEGCSMHYFDSRGVARVYGLDADHGAWRFWREWPGFSQRYVCTISADGQTMTGNGQLSRDGTTWEQDLHITYRRAG